MFNQNDSEWPEMDFKHNLKKYPQLGKGSRKKVMEFPITLEGPPSLKLWNTFFYLFYIWVLKSVLMQRIFFYITFSHKIQDLGRVSTKKGIVSDGGGGVTKG